MDVESTGARRKCTFIVYEAVYETHSARGTVVWVYAKSPQPLRVCGLAWNSGGAGIRSVAVGLHQALGVGELVELIDVGLGNHDVDGREHE